MVTIPSKRKWSELSVPAKAGVVVMSILQVSLLAAALWDIRRRPADGIKGSKKIWTALAFINWIGPIAYFVIGRRPLPADQMSESG